jgi:hypothetical protein
LKTSLGISEGKRYPIFPAYDFRPPAEYQLQRACSLTLSGSFSPLRGN